MKKLVVAVIDGMKPAALQQAISAGVAPTLARLVRDGYSSGECISSFPSLTPVATSMITTGTGPDKHGVPSMHWYHRGEQRYVDYGISFSAARKSGVITVLKDLVYRINEEHLSRDTPTFFERLEANGVRSACTTYMIYRGPHKHEFVGTGMPGRIAGVTGMSRVGYGPSQLVYGDIFDSLGSGCRSSFGIPGRRDQHASCAALAMIAAEAYDFMLLSLPDNDNYSHREGPDAQPVSIAHADEQIQKVIDAYGGYRAFMEDHAVIVLSDHSHSHVEEGVDLLGMLGAADWTITPPRSGMRRSKPAQLAVSPAARFGAIYLLDPDRRGVEVPLLTRDLRHQEKIEHVIWLQGDEAAVTLGDSELRFAPGTTYTDSRGATWDVEGDFDALDLVVADDQIVSATYPDALARTWSALHCGGIGDVLVTPRIGCEFFDWGGVAHVGGGTHGSLHVDDSAAQLVVTGTGEAREHQSAWSIGDVYSLVLEHFGIDPAAA
ncbi:MAG: alkaline phosphatase family protein [Solirubrobacterales bacterium]